jgi:hypothetical protein
MESSTDCPHYEFSAIAWLAALAADCYLPFSCLALLRAGAELATTAAKFAQQTSLGAQDMLARGGRQQASKHGEPM